MRLELLAVDPGASSLAWAHFFDSNLRQCGMIQCATLQHLGAEFRHIVEAAFPGCLAIEVPQIYSQAQWKGDPNDCIDVAIAAGVAIGQVEPSCIIHKYRPRQWKGTKKKAVDHRQTRAILSATELDIVTQCGVSKGKLHNVLDAVGVGLRKLNRRQRHE